LATAKAGGRSMPVRLPAGEWSGVCVLRRDRLGGAIHEYNLAA